MEPNSTNDNYNSYMIKGVYVANSFFDLTELHLLTVEDASRIFNRSERRIIAASRELGILVLELKGSIKRESPEKRLKLIFIKYFQIELLKSVTLGSEKKINTQPKLLGVTKQSSISHRSFGQRYLLSKTKQSLIQQNSLPEKNPTSSDKNGEMVVWLCVYLHMCLINFL